MVITPQQLNDVVKQINAEFKALTARVEALEAAAAKPAPKKTVKKA